MDIIPDAAALAQAFADADILNDCDVSRVRSERPGKASFMVDDSEYEYEVTIHRTQIHPAGLGEYYFGNKAES